MITQQKVLTTDTPNQGRVKWNTDYERIIAKMQGYTGPNNCIWYDKDGYPSIMVFVPRFNWDPTNGFNSTAIHPAFIVNGVEKTGFWVSKYENVLLDANNAIYAAGSVTGSAHSYKAACLPGVAPRFNIDFDGARRACVNMNGNGVAGFHLMTNAEWAAVALWSKQNNTMPYGNNNYGRDVDQKHVCGEIISGDTFGSGNSRWKTGSGGPLTSHDRSPYGIFDMAGNLYEWVDGLKLVDGKIYVAGNLNSSPTIPGNSYGAAEADWLDTGRYISWDGVNSYFTISDSGRGTTMSGASPDYKSRYFGDITGQISDDLKKLIIGPVSGGASGYGYDYYYARNFDTRVPLRSGSWSAAGSTGVFYLNLDDTRSGSSNAFGFRSALVV